MSHCLQNIFNKIRVYELIDKVDCRDFLSLAGSVDKTVFNLI